MRAGVLAICGAAVAFAQVYRIETAATGAQLREPAAVAADRQGRLFIADTGNSRVLRVDTNGAVRTLAEGVAANDVALDAAGNVYISSSTQVSVLRADGSLEMLAGPDQGLSSISSIAAAPDGTLLVADGGRLRRIAADRTVGELSTGSDAAVTAVTFTRDGTVYFLSDAVYQMATSGAVTRVNANVPVEIRSRIAVDSYGHLYISGSKIWKVAGQSAFVVAGTDAVGLSGDGGPSTSAQVNSPGGLAIDPAGNVYFADTGNHRVRVLVAAAAIPPLTQFPQNGAVDVPARLTLQWSPTPFATLYEVHLGAQVDGLTSIGATDKTSISAGSLEPGKQYYWRVAARAGALSLVTSPTWSFTTSPVGAVAETPSSPVPTNQSIGQPSNVWLRWTARHAARFDVYLGENQPPPRLATVDATRYRVGNLKPETTYYWMVVPYTDGTPGDPASSALWQFTTAPSGGYPFQISAVAGATLPTADGLAANASVLELPRRPATDGARNVYFIDGGRKVRKIAADGKLSTVFTAASGQVAALAADSSGNLFIAMPEYVLRINRAGQRAFIAGQPGKQGFSGDGSAATQALFNGISSIAVDNTGMLLAADSRNHRIRSVSTAGIVRTVAGSGTCGEGERSGAASDVPLCSPSEVAADTAGNVYVFESGRLLRISGGSMQVILDGVDARGGLTVSSSGALLFADRGTMQIRRLESDGSVSVLAGEPPAGDTRAFGFFGDGLPATRARFGFPDGIVGTPDGEVIIADWYNHRIRRIDTAGIIDTIAGMDTAWGERGVASAAFLFRPTDVAVDAGGSAYVADSYNQRIRRVTPGRILETLAGTNAGVGSFADTELTGERVGKSARDIPIDMLTGGTVEVDDNGTVLFADTRFSWYLPDRTAAVFGLGVNGTVREHNEARVQNIGGLTRGPAGALYVSDVTGHRVIRLAADGSVTTVAGTGVPGHSGDGGPSVFAQLDSPGPLSFSPDGDLYIGEFGRIRKVARDGSISTVANEHANGLAHDALGNLYVSSNRFVYVLGDDGRLIRIAGRDNAPATTDGMPAIDAKVGEARGIAASSDGEVYVADFGENRVWRLNRNLPSQLVLVSGGGQTVAPGAAAAERVAVRLVGRTGTPVAGVTVRFSNPDRGFALVPLPAMTNADGLVSFRPNAGSRTGEFVMTLSVVGVPPLDVKLTVR